MQMNLNIFYFAIYYLSKKELQFYINTDITAREAAGHYGMSEVVFRRTLREYGIHKNAEQKRITHLKHVQERKCKKPTKE